jgi:metal-responsive CopG/Arc/MetJ family transcriptional regulator
MVKMKFKISISVDEETLNQADISVLRHKFRNRSHAFEHAFNKLMEESQNEK